MFSKRTLPFLIVVLAGALFIGFQSLGTKSLNPPGKYEKILHNVGEMLSQIHYSPKAIDDSFSKEVFKKYLGVIDQEKSFFVQDDVKQLRIYETKLDDEILGGPVKFVPAVAAIFKKRVNEADSMIQELLSKPFTFKADENVVLDPEKLEYPQDMAAKKEMWRKRLKYMVLERYVDLLDTQEKNKEKDKTTAIKTNEQLEAEARDKVKKIMNRTFDRYKFKYTEDEQFNYYVNTVTSTMDPHTTFFPPVDKRYFDEQMSGRFFGIGASLREEDGGIKVMTLITGSPAWKSGQISVGDIIVKVAQGKGEAVDLTGFAVEDAVKLIRGSKGTEVKLTLKKVDGGTKVVSLIRDEIVQDETFARSTIVDNGTTKVGYIFLPEFYADFENPKGARCSADVAKELLKLKEQKVDGVVLDLRNNGGGSLYDVVQMVGLFIEDGPVVQVKDKDGKPSILRDRDKSVLYDGPLAVMVNEFSASASEIFAAAIQDYHRGVIIGSTTTYGKGTVQRNIGLDQQTGFLSSNSELGTIKLTLQKFYRINGGSTQLRGVSSDVVLPDVFEYSKLREKDDPDALPWDEIQKADYTPWNPGFDLNIVYNNSSSRVNSNPVFNDIKTNTKWLADQNNKVYSLNIDKFREDRKNISATIKKIEAMNKLPKELDVTGLPQDANKYANDKDRDERFKQWQKFLRNDIYLNEAVNVVNDMVVQRNLAKNEERK